MTDARSSPESAVIAFKAILRDATAGVSAGYFSLHTADGDAPIPRERVYCYELYHQLRLEWERHFAPDEAGWGLAGYQINGEIDKAGHTAFWGELRAVKPDLVVHRSGTMADNLVALEVKSSSEALTELAKDVTKLAKMVECVSYHSGILLIFGRLDQEKHEQCSQLAQANSAKRGAIEVWLHSEPGQAAALIDPPAARSESPERREAEAPTTRTGHINRNQQRVIRPTNTPGTDHMQYVYVLRCGRCEVEYGANGSDIHLRKCPSCQGGARGLRY